MNLLDSVLCTSNAREYTENFKKQGLDVYTLKLLTDEDLKILGVTEEEKRSLILQHAANLQIPAEKRVPIVIDQKYIELILAQMSVQLTKHLAALSIAVNRSDTVICNIKLSSATNCLRSCVISLEKQLDEFEEKAAIRVNRRSNHKRVVISILVVACVGFVSYKFCKNLPQQIRI